MSQPFSTSEWTPARRILVAAGALIIAATWVYLVLVRPTDWESVGGATEARSTSPATASARPCC